MLRVKYNHAYPYNIVMMKHAPFIATEKSVKAHETRPDGRALSANTGYQFDTTGASPALTPGAEDSLLIRFTGKVNAQPITFTPPTGHAEQWEESSSGPFKTGRNAVIGRS